MNAVADGSYVPSVNISQVADAIFSKEWTAGCLVKDVWKPMGASSFEACEWLERSDGCQGRTASRKVVVKLLWECGPLSVETCLDINYKFSFSLNYENRGTQALVIENQIASSGVPYADYFLLNERIALLEDRGGVDVSRKLSIEMVKQTIFKPAILWHVKEGQRQAHDIFLSILKSYSSGKDHEPKELSLGRLREVSFSSASTHDLDHFERHILDSGRGYSKDTTGDYMLENSMTVASQDRGCRYMDRIYSLDTTDSEGEDDRIFEVYL